MRKSFLSTAVAAALLVPGLAAAQAASPITGNMSLVSDYRFRGLTQTFEEPALQGGFDYAHPSGIYIGNWNSSISDNFYAGSPLEMDFYGGYKGSAMTSAFSTNNTPARMHRRWAARSTTSRCTPACRGNSSA
jgi:uncharacterized protein (TIGR02001 family)